MSTQTLIATLLGAAGVLISLSVLYLSQVRGPSVKVQLLDLPFDWSMQYWKGQGSVKFSAVVQDAAYCQLSAVANMLITNDGPKGGAVRNFMVTCPGLSSCCTVQPPTDLPATMTLSGYETAGIQMTLALAWPMAHTDQMLSELSSPDRVFGVVLSYTRHRGGGEQRRASQLTIRYRDIWDSLNNGQTGLADLSVRNQADQQFSGAFGQLNLSEGDTRTLRDALWWPIHNPDQPLDYPMDDLQGVPRLRFRNDLAFSISGTHTTQDLGHIRDEHRRLVEATVKVWKDRVKTLQIQTVPRR